MSLNELLESHEVRAGLITAIISIVGAIIRWWVAPRGRVKWAVMHRHTFVTRPNAPAGEQPAGRMTMVNTRTIWVQNLGRATVKDVEVMLNYPPQHFETWPQRQYSVHPNPAGNFLIKFEGLNPREYVTIAMLNVDFELPLLTNVRWDGGVATEAPMAPQQVFPRPVQILVIALLASGAIGWVYTLTRLALWLLG